MKVTGIVRRIDDLGRIVIPKEIRRQIFGTHDASGKPMELFMSGNDIVLKKYEENTTDYEKEIRNKVIEEFAERLKEKCFDSSKNLNVYSSFREFVDEIASQLKGEKEC